MKNLLFIITVSCVSIGSALHAQDADNDPRGEFGFGMKAGVNYSNVWDERGENFQADAKFGFAGGVYFSIPFGRFVGMQPEVMVSQKGFRGDGVLAGSSYSFARTTTYLDIPLLLQVKPVEALAIVAGPYYSYLLHEKNKYTYGANSSAQEQEFNNQDIRKNILGFTTGADIMIQHMVISGRLGWDLQTNHRDGSSSTPRYKNKWIQFTVGFRI